MKKIAVVGVFSYVDDLLAAIARAKEAGPKKLVAYTPVPMHEVQGVLEKKVSPVRFFTLLGALFGLSGGFALAIWSSLKWGLITGGKPVVTIPPFVVVGFEMTILFGAIATLVGLILVNQFPNYRIRNTYDPRFSRDKLGLAVLISEDQRNTFEEIFQSSGAEEIHVR